MKALLRLQLSQHEHSSSDTAQGGKSNADGNGFSRHVNSCVFCGGNHTDEQCLMATQLVKARKNWPNAPVQEVSGGSSTKRTLFFHPDDDSRGYPVMNGWETLYMQVLAEIVTCASVPLSMGAAEGKPKKHNSQGGQDEEEGTMMMSSDDRRGNLHVLEVGFGMGISANFLQQQPTVSQHTIVEANATIAATARQFASKSSKVTTILEGFWEDVLCNVPDESFDAILFDTYPLSAKQVRLGTEGYFGAEAYRLLKPHGTFTFFIDEQEERDAMRWFQASRLQLLELGFRCPFVDVVPVQVPVGNTLEEVTGTVGGTRDLVCLAPLFAASSNNRERRQDLVFFTSKNHRLTTAFYSRKLSKIQLFVLYFHPFFQNKNVKPPQSGYAALKFL
jgi:hypothetical protein